MSKSDRASVLSRFWAKVNTNGPIHPVLGSACWVWTARTNHKGYGRFDRILGETRAHRISWALANGPVAPGLRTLHRCDVPACVNPAHLWLGTDSDNMRDARDKGRLRLPVCHHKISAAIVSEIRSDLGRGLSCRRIAARLSVSKSLVSAIHTGKRHA